MLYEVITDQQPQEVHRPLGIRVGDRRAGAARGRSQREEHPVPPDQEGEARASPELQAVNRVARAITEGTGPARRAPKQGAAPGRKRASRGSPVASTIDHRNNFV